MKNLIRGLKISSLSLDSLAPSEAQPREHFNDAKIEELATSIQQYGILQPLLVRKTSGKSSYEIIAGERRWRAAKLARLKKIPCIITNMVNEEALAVALVENIQREDLNPIEEAHAYKKVMETLKIHQEELAQRVGKDRATIANTLRLLRLPKDIQQMLSRTELSMGHARAILALDKQDMMSLVAKKIIREGLSVRRVESLIRSLKTNAALVETKKNSLAQSDQDPMMKEIQKKIEYKFGLRTLLKREQTGVYALTINFQNNKELNDMLEQLNIEL